MICKKGQSLAEYGLILALVATVAIGGLTMLGGSVSDQLNGLASSIGGTTTGGKSIAVAASPGGVVASDLPLAVTIPAASATPAVAEVAEASPNANNSGGGWNDGGSY